jgi:carboxymethylenebutenolidase
MDSLTDLDAMDGYLARPSTDGPWPGVIVVHEWWGLDEQTKSIADRLAGVGYLSIAPDLFHGELAGDREQAARLVEKHSAAERDLVKVFDSLKQDKECSGTVGCVGFCFGGRMSLMLALQRPMDAICTFYGGGMHRIFDRLGGLKSPVLGLFGDQDESIPVERVREFERRLITLGLENEIVIYPDSGHAFFRDSDPAVYRPEAAADAWQRLTRFFARHLQQPAD